MYSNGWTWQYSILIWEFCSLYVFLWTLELYCYHMNNKQEGIRVDHDHQYHPPVGGTWCFSATCFLRWLAALVHILFSVLQLFNIFMYESKYLYLFWSAFLSSLLDLVFLLFSYISVHCLRNFLQLFFSLAYLALVICVILWLGIWTRLFAENLFCQT